MKQHLTPCAECPWRRSSAPGYLGASTPQEFLACADSEARMPCHVHLDYEDPEWEGKVPQVPRCAGRAIHYRNRCKQPRSPGEREFVNSVQADPVNVFQWPDEFIAHHSK